ncbi:hypothetical protein KKE54_08630 [bacterium]|nr:hypothetical protein [bacterium]
MNLPAITIPVQIPDIIPLLLHPVAVHFAVVFPLIILILELINLITKRKALSITVYILFVLLVGVFAVAYATGLTDGKEAGPFLSDEGMAALKSHKLLGTYLVYLTLLPLLLKVLSLLVKKGWSRALYSIALVVVIALTFFQAKKGGELVYSYGANVSSQRALEERVEELNDTVDTLKNGYEEQIAALKADLSDCNQSLYETNSSAAATGLSDIKSTKVRSVDVNLTKEIKVNEVNTSKKIKVRESNGSK